MKNFSYYNPTRIFFGQGQIAAIKEQIPAQSKVLILYGGGSIKQNGVLDQVKTALSQHQVWEFSGIEPNPRYETLQKAIEVIQQHDIDYLLAVGGGSVIDGSKFLAVAACYEGNDPWELIEKRIQQDKALPLGCILTLPATGSESNSGAVITHQGKGLKLSYMNEKMFPRFAILDPATTFTLPARQIGNGVVDAFVHVLEQYLTYPAEAPVQDRYAEGLLQTLIEVGPKTFTQTDDYEARAALMWAANQALNGLIGCGVPQDWSTHAIGHEITAVYGLDHAQSLAAVLPHSLSLLREEKREKLLQYAARVWGINSGSESERIDAAIIRTREFFESLGLKTSLAAWGIPAEAANLIAQRLTALSYVALGERRSITPDRVQEILSRSLA